MRGRRGSRRRVGTREAEKDAGGAAGAPAAQGAGHAITGRSQRVADQLGYRGRVGARAGCNQADIDDGVTAGGDDGGGGADPASSSRRSGSCAGRTRSSSRRRLSSRRSSTAHRGDRRASSTSTVTSSGSSRSAGCCRSLRAPTTRPSAAAAPSARAVRDAVMMPVLMALWVANRKVYGAHKLWKAARRAGHDIGRDQVARLMRELGIEGVRRRRRGVHHPAGSRRARGHRTWSTATSPPTGPNAAVGHRPDLRADLVGDGLRVLHRRRVLPA